jgi:hypothetical protein
MRPKRDCLHDPTFTTVRTAASRIPRHTIVAVEGNGVFSALCSEALKRHGVHIGAKHSFRTGNASTDALLASSLPDGVYRFAASTPPGIEEERQSFRARVAAVRVLHARLAAGLVRRRQAAGGEQLLMPDPNCVVIALHAGPPSAVEMLRVVLTVTAVEAETALYVHPLTVVDAMDPEAAYYVASPAAARRLNLVPPGTEKLDDFDTRDANESQRTLPDSAGDNQRCQR